MPDAPLVQSGPYRFVDHPNYWVVIAEIAVLPLIFGLWQVALIFSLLNAAVLTVRIRARTVRSVLIDLDEAIKRSIGQGHLSAQMLPFKVR